MTFMISLMVLFASLLTIVSGVWVIIGLFTELIHPSDTSNEPSAVASLPNPEKNKNATE